MIKTAIRLSNIQSMFLIFLEGVYYPASIIVGNLTAYALYDHPPP